MSINNRLTWINSPPSMLILSLTDSNCSRMDNTSSRARGIGLTTSLITYLSIEVRYRGQYALFVQILQRCFSIYLRLLVKGLAWVIRFSQMGFSERSGAQKRDSSQCALLCICRLLFQSVRMGCRRGYKGEQSQLCGIDIAS